MCVHTPDVQFVPVEQSAPSRQALPHVAHALVVQTSVMQSPLPVQVFATGQLGEHHGGPHLLFEQTLPPVHALPVVQQG